MKERLLQIEERIDALPVARRVWMFAGAALAVLAVAWNSYIAPLTDRRATLKSTISQQRQQIEAADQEMEAVLKANQNDPDAVLRRRLAQVNGDAETAGKALMALQQGLVQPQRIVPLLQQILHGYPGLRVNSLRTLAVEGLGDTGFHALSTSSPEPILYRHGVQIVVQGSYADLLSYMEALEKLRPRLIWGSAELSAIKYPESSLTLMVYTLSLDETWMKL
jgi:MSHA biogenesis protein MshJ